MEALGRLVNFAPIAAGTLIALKEGTAVTFLCTGDDTFTLKSAATYNGSPSALTAITRYYTNTSAAGAAAWADSGDITAVDSVAIASGAVCFHVDRSDLPAGARYVSVSVTSAGLVSAITHDLAVERSPSSLLPLSGASS